MNEVFQTRHKTPQGKTYNLYSAQFKKCSVDRKLTTKCSRLNLPVPNFNLRQFSVVLPVYFPNIALLIRYLLHPIS